MGIKDLELYAQQLGQRSAQSDAVSQSLTQGLDQNPDEYAKLLQISARTGVAPALAKDFRPELEKRARITELSVDQMVRTHPKTAQFLSDRDNAAISHDDTSALKTIEDTLLAVPAGLVQGWDKQRQMFLNYKEVVGTISPAERAELEKLDDLGKQRAKEYSKGAPSYFKAASDVVGMSANSLIDATSKDGATGMAVFGTTGLALSAVGGPAAPALAPFTGSAGAITGFGVGTTTGVMINTYESSVGETYDDLKNFRLPDGTKLDPTVARYASLVAGVPNTALETFALGKALKVIPFADKVIGQFGRDQIKEILVRPTMRAAMADIGTKYAVAVGTETFTEGLQKFVSILAREAAVKATPEGGKPADPDWYTKNQEHSKQAWQPTTLQPKEEVQFREWLFGTKLFNSIKGEIAAERDVKPERLPNAVVLDALDSQKDYDYRAAWKKGITEVISPHDGRPHWPSKAEDGTWLKSPTHSTSWMEFFMQETGKDPESLGLKTEEQARQWSMKQLTTPRPDGRQGRAYDEGQLRDDVKSIIDESTEAFKASVVLGGLGGGVKTYQARQEVKKAEETQAVFQAIADGVKDVKTNKRVPERFQQFVDQATKDGPVQNVYIGSEEFSRFFQSQGVDPEKVAAEVGVSNYRAAMAAGSDIVIPMAQFASKIAPTEYLQGIMQDARLRQGDMSLREAQLYQAEQEARDAELLANMEQIVAEQQAAGGFSRVVKNIVTEMEGQFLSIGMTDQMARDEAVKLRGVAVLAEKDLKLRAAREGRQVSDLEIEEKIRSVWERYGMTMNRKIPDVLTTAPTSDISIDPLLDSLRAGNFPTDAEIFGMSLSEFIRSKGGIKPQGEFTDMNAGTRPFQSKLIKPTGMDIGLAAEAAVEAGYFPDRDMATITDNEFLDALDADIKGNAVYSVNNTRNDVLAIREAMNSLGEYLDSLGIDLQAITNNAGVRRLIDNARRDPALEGIVNELEQYISQFNQSAVPLAPNGRPSNLSPELHALVRTPEFKAWFGDWEKFAAMEGGVWADANGEVSKAVDENGEPLVLYHGTDAAGFTAFETPTGSKRGDLGIFLTPNRSMAQTYVKRGVGKDLTREQVLAADGEKISGIYPLFANIRNPYETDFEGANWNGERPQQFEIFDENGDKLYDPTGKGYFTDEELDAELARLDALNISAKAEPAPEHFESTDSAVREARNSGNDGTIIRNVVDDGGGASSYASEPSDVFVALQDTQVKSIENFGSFDANNGNMFYQTEQAFDQTQTEDFKRFSNDAPLVTGAEAETYPFKTGEKVVLEAYHGTKRPDRVGTKFLKKRATSGPMAYHTSDPTLASSYATGKEDTSLSDEEQDYANWFKYKPKGQRTPVDIVRAWFYLDAETKAKIAEKAPTLRLNDDLDGVVSEDGNTRGNGSYDYNLSQTRTAYMRNGNPLKALVEDWLSSGNLFNNEELFMDVLRQAGFPMNDTTYDSPFAAYPFVYKNYIAMQKPLVTSDIPQEVVDALNAAAKSDRSRAKPTGADMWDKRTRTVRDWVAEFNKEDNKYVWTSIPDKVTEVFKSLGYDGIIDWSGKGGGTSYPVYIPFEETQVKSAIGNKGTFDTSKNDILKQGGDDARGYIQFNQQRKFSITLLENANESTVTHELGHFYLEVLGDFATAEGAGESLVKDYQTVLEFLGAKSRDDLTLDGKEKGSAEYNRAVEMHEKFARANEAYWREGKAPSIELQGVFQRFKYFLSRLYEDIKSLNVQLNDDVRAVFDRIYATDAEIEAAKEQVNVDPIFLTAAEAGMSEQEFALYREGVAKTTESGKEALLVKLIREMDRSRKAWWKEEREKMKTEVTKEVDEQQVYRAFAALLAGKVDDDTPVKLNKQALIDRYGADYVKKLPRSFGRIYTPNGGMDADSAAEMLGYDSGDALIQAIVGMRDRKDLIEAETDQRMLNKHGDMLNDGSIADAAKIALHNTQREDMLMSELRALRRKQREVAPFVNQAMNAQRQQARAATDVPPVEAFRRAAQGIVDQTAPRDLSPYGYLQASRRAAKAAFAAMAKGDYQVAADNKQKELLNHFLYLEATKAREEADKILTYARKFEKTSTRQQMGKAGADYLEQIDGILDRYEFRRVPLRQLDRRQSLREWINGQEALGNEPAIAQELLDESRAVNYRQIPMSELRAIRDAVKNIEHLARYKNKLVAKQDEIAFDDAIAELVASAENMTAGNGDKAVGERKPLPIDPNAIGFVDRAGDAVQRLDAMLLKMEQVVEWLDNGNVNGAWHTYLWNPIAEAQTREYDITRQLTEKLAASLEKMPKAQRTSMLDTYEIAGMGKVTRKFLISVALNMGTQSNIDKMMRGMGWNMDTIEVGLSKLNDADWTFVQETWDTINTLWPEIAALEKRMTGLEPPKVEAQPYQVRDENGNVTRTLAGGYYPLVYDPRKSEQGAKQEGGNLGQLFEEGYVRATTPKGHTQARMEGFAAPMLLDFEQVVTQHMAKVVKDLTHREAVVQANKILTNPEIRNVLQETLGEHYEKQFLPWLRSVVNDRNGGSTQGVGDFSRWMMTARANVVAATMGFKATTMIAQITGISQSLDKVKGRYLGQALIEYLRHPIALTREVREKSGEMRNRSNTLDRDIRDQLRKLTGQTSTWAQAQKFAFHGIAIADAMVTVPTWMGAYRQAKAGGADEATAILEADAAVRMTQGAGGAKDLAAIQRNNELAKSLTMFYSYFSVLYARQRDMGRDVQQIRDMPRFLSRVFFTIMFPAVMGELILGRGPDDDEDPAEWAIRKVLLYPLMTLPVLRDVVSSIDSGFDYRFSPMASLFEKIVMAVEATGKIITEDDKGWSDYAARVADTIGYVFGVAGTAQISSTGKYLWRVSEGEEQPDNLAELLAYALLGKRKKD